jgi:quercetin dioxygenase-like cupin family protein
MSVETDGRPAVTNLESPCSTLISAWMTNRVIAMKKTTISAGDDDNTAIVKAIAKTALTVTGQPILLPKDGPEVTVTMYDVPPRTRMPAHRHPHPRYGYVLSGHLRVTNFDAETVGNFSEGDFVVEARMQWHVGENPGDTPLKLLVIDQTPPGTSNIEAKT